MSGNKWSEDFFTPVKIKQKPSTSITAKTAVPFITGIALVHGNVAIEHFLPENLENPRVLEIAKKVNFKLDAGLGSFSSRVEFKTKNGKTYHAGVDTLRGSIGNPLSVEEIAAKFRDCARYARKPLSADKVEYLIESILNLEKIKDISKITVILC
jgi:2-methylcitrate dehydratase PrpD